MPSEVGHISTYNELLDRIVAEFARGDIRTDAVSWVAATELEIFRDTKPKPADLKTTGTIAKDDDTLRVPRGTTHIYAFQLNLSRPNIVVNRSLAEVVQRRELDASGIPKYFAWQGSVLELGPVAGAVTPYSLWYRGLPAELSDENQTNLIFQYGWDVYLYGSLFHGSSTFGGHPMVQTWDAMYRGKLKSLADLFWDMDASEPLEQFSVYGQINDSHSEY